MSYAYQARVVETGKRFTLESKKQLRVGATVKDKKDTYRVAYMYPDGKAPVVILAPKKKKLSKD